MRSHWHRPAPVWTSEHDASHRRPFCRTPTQFGDETEKGTPAGYVLVPESGGLAGLRVPTVRHPV